MDTQVRKRIVQEIAGFCASLGLKVGGTCASPLLGPEGNTEFFIFAGKTMSDGN
jgi:predicted rRNA methylase YqxC with S4 and FtsJ domains